MRKLTDAEMLSIFSDVLDTLADLCKIYDAGKQSIVFLMATEIQKILTSGGTAARLRNARTFKSVEDWSSSNQLNSYWPLVVARVGGSPPQVHYRPSFYRPVPQFPPSDFKFVDWWQREIIYRASAAITGSVPPGAIPVNDTPRIEFEDRETLTRREFIKLLRDKRGAHPDDTWPELLDELGTGMTLLEFVSHDADGNLISTSDGSISIAAHPLGAMARQVAHEVLVAYGRDDDPPPDAI